MFPVLAGSNPSGYNLTRSLRFRSSATAYLNRTPASASNRTTWTWSGWVKRGALGSLQSIFGAGAYSNGTFLYFTSSDVLYFEYYDGVSVNPRIQSVAVYRDPAAWYHIVFVWDSSNATANDRMRLYVNGLRITSLAVNVTPTQNLASAINNNIAHYVGQLNNQYPLDGYLAEVNFIDGQALTPSSFGSTNALTGVWQPARYAGTYGTNGFYLPFTDNSALTTASNVGLGKDFSGNGNYWTTNNISITAGVTYDSMTDVPTLTSATAANFCTWNPVAQSTVVNGTVTRSNGNLTSTDGGTTYGLASIGTIASTTGKFYWEVTLSAAGDVYANIGVVDLNSPLGAGVHTGLLYAQNGTKNSGSNVFASGGGGAAYGASYTVGDVIGVALDLTAGTITFYKNNTSQGVAYTGISGNYTPAVGDGQNTTSYTFNLNCGQRPFTYTPPTGFVALNTFNLPTSTILQGNKVMDATLYTGTLLSNAVTNAAAFKPDLVWVKSRSAATDHKLTDSVRGVAKGLISNTTGAETTDTQGLTAFGSAGFTVGTDTNYNNLAATYVAWQWQAGQGSTSSNTSGSITSTVSVNASAGFSVITFNGTGAAATVGHGLGVAPAFYIAKYRSGSAPNIAGWACYHSALTSAAYRIDLNSTSGQISDTNAFNSTAPTSSVLSIGTNLSVSSTPMVVYAWTPIAGYSAFGSLTGNGAADNAFVYTGFLPRFVLLKRTDSVSNWYIWDTARNTYNVFGNELYPNLSNAETSATDLDVLSNGFKLRSASFSGTWIYAAFATTPFKNSLGF